LGLTALPPEFAGALKVIATDTQLGGGFIEFPFLSEFTPEAARILVQSLNRGVEARGYIRSSKSPTLYFGSGLSLPGTGMPTLPPDVVTELAKYEGTLGLFGLREFPAKSAAALETFPGPYLRLSGPATEIVSPEVAASLAKVAGNLLIPLRELDSEPLAARFARQITWTLQNLESVSKDSVPALIQYKQTFQVRKIGALESPELAKRFLGNNYGPTLPALTRLSPEAAGNIAQSPNSMLLGLDHLDSERTARALSTAKGGVKLPRLRAVTPEVLAVLKEAKSIETPALDGLYTILPEAGK